MDDDHLETFVSQPLATRTIMFNTRRAPTDSLGVRKAIAHAVDKLVGGGSITRFGSGRHLQQHCTGGSGGSGCLAHAVDKLVGTSPGS